MTSKDWIEIASIAIMIIGLGGVLYDRIKTQKGIGVRIIQFLAVIFIFPVILILTLEGVLKSEVAGTLLGTIVGYILSGIGK